VREKERASERGREGGRERESPKCVCVSLPYNHTEKRPIRLWVHSHVMRGGGYMHGI